MSCGHSGCGAAGLDSPHPPVTRYIQLPRAPTHPPQHPSARRAPALPPSSTHRTQCAAQHPPWRGAARCYPTTDNTRHNPHPRTPWVAKGTQHAQHGHEGELRGFVLPSPKEGLSAGIWRRKVVCAPVGGTTPQVAILGPTSRRWGEVPHRRLGMAAWTHLANGEGIWPSSAWTRRREVK